MCIFIWWVFTNIELMVIWTSEHFDLVSLHLDNVRMITGFCREKMFRFIVPKNHHISVALSGHRDFFFRVISGNRKIMGNDPRHKMMVYVSPCVKFSSHSIKATWYQVDTLLFYNTFVIKTWLDIDLKFLK